MQWGPKSENTALAQGHIGCSCAGCVKSEQITRRSKGDSSILSEEGQGPRKRERLSTRDSVASGTQSTPGHGPSTILAQSGTVALAGQARGQQLNQGVNPINSPALLQREIWNRGLNNASERSSPMFFAQSRTQHIQAAQPTQPAAPTRSEQALPSPQQRQTFERAPQAQPAPTVTTQIRTQTTQASPTARIEATSVALQPRQAFEPSPQPRSSTTASLQSRTPTNQGARAARTENAAVSPQQRPSSEQPSLVVRPVTAPNPQSRNQSARLKPEAAPERVARAVSQKGELKPKPLSVRQRSAEAQARKLQAAALERRRIEVLGKVQRILERTASARSRGLPLSELMRLEVVSQVVELLEGDEYLGLSDRRLHSRLSKMSRLNRTRIRGNSLRKDQERELKNKGKGAKQETEGQQASTSGSQMLSGTQAGKATVVTQKISSAKTGGPSKSLDIFQAKTDDDGDELDLLSE